MVVPDEIRKCVGFIGYQKADLSVVFAGTVFFLGKTLPSVQDRTFIYAVTAKHVIEGIKSKGIDRIFLRLNRKGQDAVWVGTPASDWLSSPTDAAVDVAACPVALDESWDHLCFPSACVASKQVIETKGIDIGDEVSIAGLFSHHMGRKRNIPIVRTGNIAAMPEEKVYSAMGQIDAYLIEARSTGGLSGSPVFVNPAGVRHGILKLDDGPQLFLLGLMHGHFEASDAGAEESARAKINLGIGVVVPAGKIMEVISQPIFADREKRAEEEYLRRNMPSMD
jgi:hypothetical protein